MEVRILQSVILIGERLSLSKLQEVFSESPFKIVMVNKGERLSGVCSEGHIYLDDITSYVPTEYEPEELKIIHDSIQSPQFISLCYSSEPVCIKALQTISTKIHNLLLDDDMGKIVSLTDSLK
ncbi:hypothetical protein [Paenibacillus sp. Root444D2]|uniref:hypothetical protein n=1 Tax=Paenibacillus sp. Root444D2 TaxID=1736538 RepID=UPI00070A949C|nr:hypothetical protein [Paenibacillus sp. Root444D2]KQX51393.1 hypothetical protein ASD40_35475 [Paenibacillus sp. Root444D2]